MSRSSGSKVTGAPPKSNTARKKRRRTIVREKRTRYLVAIESWDWTYSFGIDGRKNAPDPYMEFRHVQIMGKLLHPVMPKVEMVEIDLLPNSILDEDRRKDDVPSAVGSLSLSNGRLTGLFSIPTDALTPILQMLIADRFQFVDMNGAPLRHRQTLVTSFRLETHIDDDDMPNTAEAI